MCTLTAALERTQALTHKQKHIYFYPILNIWKWVTFSFSVSTTLRNELGLQLRAYWSVFIENKGTFPHILIIIISFRKKLKNAISVPLSLFISFSSFS